MVVWGSRFFLFGAQKEGLCRPTLFHWSIDIAFIHVAPVATENLRLQCPNEQLRERAAMVTCWKSWVPLGHEYPRIFFPHIYHRYYMGYIMVEKRAIAGNIFFRTTARVLSQGYPHFPFECWKKTLRNDEEKRIESCRHHTCIHGTGIFTYIYGVHLPLRNKKIYSSTTCS